jgi:hypothetical protein
MERLIRISILGGFLSTNENKILTNSSHEDSNIYLLGDVG